MSKIRRLKKAYTQIPSIFDNFTDSEISEEKLQFSTSVLNTLLTPHFFTKLSKSKKLKTRTLYFSESLQKLSIEEKSSNYILTTEIVSADKEFSPISLALYPNVESTHYAIKIHTSSKIFEFVTENQKQRDDFFSSLNMLISLCKEYMSSNGLKKYCDSIIEGDQEDSYRSLIRARQQNQRLHHQNYTQLERQVILDLVNSLVLQVEIQQKVEECKLIETRIKKYKKDRTELSLKQENVRNKINKQEEEIENFKSQIKIIETNIGSLSSTGCCYDNSIYTVKIWSHIIEFLKAKEILAIRNICRLSRKQTDKILMSKLTWRKMCLTTLAPRRVMYRIYMKNFYKTEIRGSGYEVDDNKSEEIKNDVWKGLNEYQQETEEILLSLCRYNPNLDYCQGMHFVSNMLYGMYRNTHDVIKIMDSLCRPPFYLSELWKNDLSRLNLGIYQTEFMLRIRLPLLSKHLKELDINLSTIVTRWFLTVFTHLHYRHEMPQEVVFEIWDFFLLQGWPALISTCLAFFYVAQDQVLNKNYEETLTVLTSKISVNRIHKIIPLFEIDPRILEDLDGSYATVSGY